MADKAAERIKYETERIRFVVLLAVAIGGGSFSLLLTNLTPLRLSLVGLGFLVAVVLTITAWRQDKWILTLIAQIKEEI